LPGSFCSVATEPSQPPSVSWMTIVFTAALPSGRPGVHLLVQLV
jgi:hypothetical protein